MEVAERNRKKFEQSMEADRMWQMEDKRKNKYIQYLIIIYNRVRIVGNNLIIRDVEKYMVRALFLIMVRNVMVFII